MRDSILAIAKNAAHCKTEEAAKLALIFPMLTLLGYPADDPTVVVPEYGTDNFTRVDIALMERGRLLALVEAKGLDVKLESYRKQLQGYFDNLHPAFAILTNGIAYELYAPEDGRMELFHHFTLDDFSRKDEAVLSLLSAESIRNAGAAAVEKAKTAAQLYDLLARQFDRVDDDVARLLLSKCQKTVPKDRQAEYAELVRQALSAAANDKSRVEAFEAFAATEEDLSDPIVAPMALEGYHVMRTLICEWTGIEPSRITYVPRKAYLSVLVDGVWICKFLFDYKQKKQVWMHCDRDGDPRGLDLYTFKFPIHTAADIRSEKEWIINTVRILTEP